MRKPSPALVLSFLALFVVLFGTAYAASKINGKKIKNQSIAGKKLKDAAVTTDKLADGSVTDAKLAGGGADDLPKVYMHFNSSGTFIPGESRGVVSINQPVPNVACLDLDFVPTTGGASRGVGAGGPPINAAQMAIGSAATALGCPASHGDAVVQVAAAASVQDVYAWFD